MTPKPDVQSAIFEPQMTSPYYNPLIDFLASYGPTASGNNMYDEFVVEAAEKHGLKPIEIDQPLIDEIIGLICGDSPKTVIFTGTAGDGKTYTARKILSKISNGALKWQNSYEEIAYCKAGHGKSIRFIKDLSELTETQKDELLPELVKSLKNQEHNCVFVICVNDGHLLKFWRDREEISEDVPNIIETIQYLLRNGKSDSPEFNLHLENMSIKPHADKFEELLDAILDHNAWDMCHDCPCFSSTKDHRCPIQINRDLLRKQANATIRARLGKVIEIVAADDCHLAIRQLIIATVNALLGDNRGSTPPLLNCERAQQCAMNGKYESTNPFANLFGDNLQSSPRNHYSVFQILGQLSIGEETNNLIDVYLLDENKESKLPDHETYGNNIFKQSKADYLDDYRKFNDLRPSIINQRRRLFFCLPETTSNNSQLDPWNLTVYQHGSKYLQLLEYLESNNSNNPHPVTFELVKGLNRLFTGMLTSTNRGLWFTESAGVLLSDEIPVIPFRSLSQDQSNFYPYFKIVIPDLRKSGIPTISRDSRKSGIPPELAICVGDIFKDGKKLSVLRLRPTLFEFLLRTAEGVLPASFSNQCAQDARRFQLEAVGAIKRHLARIDEKQDRKVVEFNNNELIARSFPLLDATTP